MKTTSQAAVLFVRGDGKMNELTISLDPHRKTPLYEQIYGFIREEIRGLAAGGIAALKMIICVHAGISF